MAYADGKADEIEENIVWRVAELLGVSSRDRLILKQKAGLKKRTTAHKSGDDVGEGV